MQIQISTAFAKMGFSLFYIRTNQYNGDCQEDPDMKLTGLNIYSGLKSIRGVRTPRIEFILFHI